MAIAIDAAIVLLTLIYILMNLGMDAPLDWVNLADSANWRNTQGVLHLAFA